jgi:alpha-tubulin suppressor-like RCC1 family protein
MRSARLVLACALVVGCSHDWDRFVEDRDGGASVDGGAPVDGANLDAPPPADAGAIDGRILDGAAADGGGEVVPLETDALDMGEDFACFIASDGRLLGWGASPGGQLGVAMARVTDAVVIDGMEGLVHVAAGWRADPDIPSSHVCGIDATRRVVCIGDNRGGQLGRPATGGPVTTAAVVAGIADVSRLDTGGEHTCAVTRDGALYCWGSDSQGNVGNGAAGPTHVPTEIDTGGPVADISAGRLNSCVVRLDGRVLCWGNNDEGQVGDGTTTDRDAPIDVGLSNVKQISVARGGACALQTDGALHCWGENYDDRYGAELASSVTSPAAVGSFGPSVASVVVGGNFACATNSSGMTRCAGTNDFGQLTAGPMRVAPPMTVSVPMATEMLAGGWHMCARAPAAVLCWGGNFNGQLGDGTTTSRPDPEVVALP